MAEYYPLISRAVAGLRDGEPEARQAIYARAKQALTGQLRKMDPPVPEEDIDREIAALDDAVARIEEEIAADPVAAEPVEPPRPVVTAPPAPPRPVASSNPAPAAPSRPAAPIAPSSTAEPTAPKPASPPPRVQTVRPAALSAPIGAQTPAPSRPERPLFTPRSSLPSARPVPTREPRPVSPPPPPASPPAEDKPEPVLPRRVEPTREAAAKPILPAAPTLDVGPIGRDVETAAPPLVAARAIPMEQAEDEVQRPVPEIPSSDFRGREDNVRPAVPRPIDTPPRNLRVWIVAAVALVAVVAIAVTAWRLRDRPEELAKTAVPTIQAPTTPGKIAERADGTAASDDGADTDAPPAGTTVPSAVPETASAIPAPASPAPASPSPAPGAPAAAPQPTAEQTIPVAQKAAILVDAPDTPEKVKTYVGTVLWSTENVSQGQDQPLGTAVRAEVDIPDAKIKLVMEIRRNTEAQFPASHTIDLKFEVAADSPIGGIKQIGVPMMRPNDAPTGDPLIGVPVTITTNYFLVGLTRGSAESHNIDEIRTRGWFDVPMVLNNDKPAKITFEKGSFGERIVNDALEAWTKS